MKYTLNYRDIGYNSSSAEVEALRRAVEIRSLSKELGRQVCSDNGVETHIWETPLRKGTLEVETVTVCERSGRVTYARHETALAS
jgi:hypothetical protein